LDIGFDGYQQLLGNELPSQVVTRSFRADGDISAGEKHGTACAEIVHDMAPEAKLYLVNFSNDVEHYNAVNWLISRNVDAISYSLGWTNAGAGDGTGPICDDVRRAANNEIAWASAAGNEAVAHWEGNFNDTDGDGWHNFSSNDEILDFWVPGSTPVAADLNWDDWGTWDGNNYSGSREDYDLYLYRLSGSDWVQVDSSTNWQTGTEWPVESIGYWEIPSATYWGIAIRKSNATRNVKLEVFIEGNAEAIEYNIPAGSIIIPADSSSAIACGATDWSNDSYHYYSSRGPTSDLRIKPDFTAPSGVSTQTYGMRSFYGTSASAPHMAGAIALLKGKTPYSLSQILTILQFRAVDLGTPGKDNQFGRGRLDLRK
jgi:subtilisin family serine protease